MMEKECNVCFDASQWVKRAKAALLRSGPSGYEPFPAPPDASELGACTWTFLHTMAAYYAETPTEQEKTMMRHFFDALGRFYPCEVCAEELRLDLSKSPPRVDNQSELSKWLCDLHNQVNERLGKPSFDCSKVGERWRYGRVVDKRAEIQSSIPLRESFSKRKNQP